MQPWHDGTSSDEHAAKRRKVRKGTHSCQACRRRKVKCIYAAPEEVRCIACDRRGTQCISQCDSPGLDDAVARIGYTSHVAGAAESQLHVLDSDAVPTDARVTYADEPYPPFVGLPTPVSVAASVSSTDEGANVGPKPPRFPPLSVSRAHSSVREALLCSLPCETDISILSGRVSLVSALCYQSDYKFHISGIDRPPKDQILVKSLLEPERHPTLLARQMLLFAAAIQHLPAEGVVPGLTVHQHVIMKTLAESAIQLVNMDDALLETLESLENLIFEIFYHLDSGDIRRAWITTRRAVTAAQMLNLHRPGYYRYTTISDTADLDPEIIWSTIVSMERMLSLLLGLPTSTGHTILAFQTVTDISALGHNLSALVGSLTAKILERNQVESAVQALQMTSEIDQQIISTAEQMPSSFWRPLALKGLDKDSSAALSETRRAFGHMCYYSLVVQLHLPYMLSPHDAAQSLHSKIACVNASREILTREIELRTHDAVSARCRLSDFLALVAGTALVLGHVIRHAGQPSASDTLLAHQRLSDRALSLIHISEPTRPY